MPSLRKWIKWIDLLPLTAIALIILVCNAANLFLLHKPGYVLATLPLAALTVWATVKTIRSIRSQGGTNP